MDALLAAVFTAFVCEGPLTGPAAGGFLLVRTSEGEATFLDCFFGVPETRLGEMEELVIDFADAGTQVFHVGTWLRRRPRSARGPRRWRTGASRAASGHRSWIRRSRSPTAATSATSRGSSCTRSSRASCSATRAEGASTAMRLASSRRTAAGRSRACATSALPLPPSSYPSSPTTSPPTRCSSDRRSPPSCAATRRSRCPRAAEASSSEFSSTWAAPASRRSPTSPVRWLQATAPLGAGPLPGTTHISVIDGRGMAAALSSTLGSGSGVFRAGTQLNNMLGELDVIGHDEKRPGERLPSMMAPTLVLDSGGPRLVVGSAGSVRLAGAIAQVVWRTLSGSDVTDAIRAPRVHVDGTDAAPRRRVARRGRHDAARRVGGEPLGGHQSLLRRRAGRRANAGRPAPSSG